MRGGWGESEVGVWALCATCRALCQGRENRTPLAGLAAESLERLEREKADYYAKRIGDERRLHRSALGALARETEATGGVPLCDAFAYFMAGQDAGRAVDGEGADRLMSLTVGVAYRGRLMWTVSCAVLRHRRRQ